jgi:hypothetical protein
MLIVQDGPVIPDPEQSEEHYGEVLEGMYASGCSSIDQARLAQEQVEELRRRALVQESLGGDSSGVTPTGGRSRKGRRPGWRFGGEASRDLCRQCSNKVKPINVIVQDRQI